MQHELSIPLYRSRNAPPNTISSSSHQTSEWQWYQIHNPLNDPICLVQSPLTKPTLWAMYGMLYCDKQTCYPQQRDYTTMKTVAGFLSTVQRVPKHGVTLWTKSIPRTILMHVNMELYHTGKLDSNWSEKAIQSMVSRSGVTEVFMENAHENGHGRLRHISR